VAEDVRVPAGWYPDPLGLPQLRWWDNHAWTEYTSDARQPMVAQETVTQQPRLTFADDDDTLSRRERRERESAGSTAPATEPATRSDGAATATAEAKPTQEALLALEAPAREDQVVVEEELSPAAKFAEFVPANAPTTPAFDLGTRFDDLLGDAAVPATADPAVLFADLAPSAPAAAAPAAAATTAPATATPVRTGRVSTNTAAVWILALLPLLQLFAAMFFLVAQGGPSAAAVFAPILFLLPYLGGVVLAFFDWRTLTDRGVERPAHWLFAFATAPVYLVARFLRTIRTTGRGFSPVAVWFATGAALLAAVVAVPGLLISLDEAAFARQAEASLVSKAAALGADIAVQCPDTVPTLLDRSFDCVASRGDIRWGVTVTLTRANGWIDWRVDDWGIFTVSDNGAGQG
jgi:hypothetical protein